MCPSEEEIFDSVLSGASELDGKEKWYQYAWKVPLGMLLYIPRRLYDLLIRPIKRRRNR
jgi:hypothetical protein